MEHRADWAVVALHLRLILLGNANVSGIGMAKSGYVQNVEAQ